MEKAKSKRPFSFWIQWATLAVLLCAMIAGWFAFSACGPAVVDSGASKNGVLDLTGFDIGTKVVEISSEWEFYPEKLYAPENFAAGQAEAPVLRSQVKDPDAIPYGTYRLVLQTAPNSYALMAGYSIDYGTCVFANGSKVISVGQVSADSKKATPSVNYMTFPVRADENGRVELVVQYSNFVHHEGGGMHNFCIASPSLMEEYQSRKFLPVNIVAGALLFIAACWLLKACMRRDADAFLLAVCCVLFTFRDQRFYVVELLPNNYNWLIQYRIYILIICLMPAFLLMLFMHLFPKASRWWMQAAVAAAAVIAGAAIFMNGTQQAVAIMDWSILADIVCAACYLVFLIRYFIKVHKPDNTDILVLCSFGVLFLGMYAEKVLGRRIPDVMRGGWTPLAMMAFVMLMILTLSLRDKKTEDALILSRQREEDLKKLNAVNREFTQIVAHEINTPLTVASGYAQMLSRQLRRGERNPNMVQTLDVISSETRRLSALVTQMLTMTKDIHMPQMGERIAVASLLEDAAAIAKPVLQKNNNFLEILCDACPDVSANRDALLQILLNLSDNAGRHTRNGKIVFSARNGDGFVKFHVRDTGDGISPENLKNIFTKGCSPDGRNGIGLSVSHDLVAAFGGTMEIESTGPGGTTFAFTVPVFREG
jgi:signal transduction histidine kinase